MAKYFVESGRHDDSVIQAKNCALEPHKIFWDHFSKSLVTIQVFTSETWAPTRLKNGGKFKKLSRIYVIAIYEHLSLIRNSHCFWIKSVQMSFTTIQKR